MGDGTFQCVAPDAVGCNTTDVADDGSANLSNLGSACSYTWGANSISGKCYGTAAGALACVAACTPATLGSSGTMCTNTNSTCQATGIIGDGSTFGVCIPNNTFTAASDCPSGTHAVDQGDGTFDCVPPSGIGCNVADASDDGAANLSNNLTACTYSHDGNDITGVCYGTSAGAQACIATCGSAGMNTFTPRVQDRRAQTPTVFVSLQAPSATQRPWVCVFRYQRVQRSGWQRRCSLSYGKLQLQLRRPVRGSIGHLLRHRSRWFGHSDCLRGDRNPVFGGRRS